MFLMSHGVELIFTNLLDLRHANKCCFQRKSFGEAAVFLTFKNLKEQLFKNEIIDYFIS